MTEEELNEAKFLLEEHNAKREDRRFDLEEKRYQLELKRAEREGDFLYRHSTTLITAAISLAAIVVSASGPITAYIQKEKELNQQEILKIREQDQTRQQEEGKLKQAQLESDRKWRSDAASYLSTHKEIIFSNNTDDQVRIREVMLLVFPSDVVDAIFKGLEVRATSSASREVWTGGRKAVDQVVTSNESTVSGARLPPDAYSSKQSLVELLNGPNRRDASNSLIRDYARNRSGVVTSLNAAIQPESEAIAYRVNLYILFTLARIPDQWEGTAEQIKAIEHLTSSKNMADPTYQKWAKQALSHVKQ